MESNLNAMINKLPKDFRPKENVELHLLDSSIAWYEDGIFYIFSLPDIDHTLEHAIFQTNLFKEQYAQGNNKHSMICDVRECRPIKRDVREYYSSSESTDIITKFAFLIDSPFSRVVANFFITMQKFPIELKMFNSVKEAEAWCRKKLKTE